MKKDHYPYSDRYIAEVHDSSTKTSRTEREHMVEWFRANETRVFGSYSWKSPNRSARRYYMEYRFYQYLIRELTAGGGHRGGIDIRDKVTLENFGVEKTSEHKGEKLSADPDVTMARGIGTALSEDQTETLSKIVAEWNAKYGRNFDPMIAAGSLVALKETLGKDEKPQKSVKVNAKRDFVNTLDDRTESALVENYDKNTDWYSFLLDRKEIRKDLIHILVDDLFDTLSRD